VRISQPAASVSRSSLLVFGEVRGHVSFRIIVLYHQLKAAACKLFVRTCVCRYVCVGVSVHARVCAYVLVCAIDIH